MIPLVCGGDRHFQ